MVQKIVLASAIIIASSLILAAIVLPNASAQFRNHQSLSQHNNQHQSSGIVTSGYGSSVSGSGNNAATATNTNNGGNAAALR